MLTLTVLKILFAVVYFIADILYVSISKDYYNNIVFKISKKFIPGFNKPFSIWFASLAYISLILGWVIFVTPSASVSLLDMISKAIIYGLSTYGLFNGTMYIMFANYPISTALRDLCWGLACVVILSVVYYFTYQKWVRQKMKSRK